MGLWRMERKIRAENRPRASCYGRQSGNGPRSYDGNRRSRDCRGPARANGGYDFAGLLVLAHAMVSHKTVQDVLLSMLPLAILVVGQTMAMLVGQIDLSMTAVMAMGSVASASVMTRFAAHCNRAILG